eukprot:jgi/Mesen1/7998/ME000425S07199
MAALAAASFTGALSKPGELAFAGCLTSANSEIAGQQLKYRTFVAHKRAQRTLSIQAASGSTRIHKLLQESGSLLLPGCYDALSASIVQKTGFAAGFISGYATSASLLGKPDFGLLTPTEMAANARNICSAVPSIPIIVDADTGGGNALNVQRTVRDLIAAGAAGTKYGRRSAVIPAEEHAMKIAAAREAIGEHDFFL